MEMTYQTSLSSTYHPLPAVAHTNNRLIPGINTKRTSIENVVALKDGRTLGISASWVPTTNIWSATLYNVFEVRLDHMLDTNFDLLELAEVCHSLRYGAI